MKPLPASFAQAHNTWANQQTYSHPGHGHYSCGGSWTLDPLTHGRLATCHFPSPKEAGSTPNLESALSRLPPHGLAFFSSEDPRELLFLFPFLFAILSLHTRVWAYEAGLGLLGPDVGSETRTSPGRGQWLRRWINRHTHLQVGKSSSSSSGLFSLPSSVG